MESGRLPGRVEKKIKPRDWMPRGLRKQIRFLGGLERVEGDGAGRGSADRGDGVDAARRTLGGDFDELGAVAGDRGQGAGGAGGELAFEGILFHRAVDLLQIGDAGVGLGRGAGLDEVRNGDGGEEADDRHDDHDFYECEALAIVELSFHVASLFLVAA
jgi:hypothetical protein